MKIRLSLVAVLLAAACATRAPVSPEHLPDWLSALIHQLESQPAANPPAFVARYDYRKNIVYYVPARCCDIPSTLYQADGAILCHPDGGFTGQGDGKCPTFADERKNEEIIWRDSR